MTEQQTGLRFDIYERVHLQENARGIAELDEVELVPFIQVLSQNEQAVLKGYLRLNGTYTGEGGEEKKQLEHQIPVEITLPLSRVGNAQSLSVEIENFDVDVLSPRSLNVTGVLSLHGVEMVSAPENNWRSEEEVVFVHRASEEPEPAAPAVEAAQPAEEARSEIVQQLPYAASPSVAAASQPVPFSFVPANEPQYTAEENPLAPAQAAAEVNEIDADSSIEVQETEAITMEQDAVEEADLLPEVQVHSEDKKEIKVGFGAKKVAEIAQEAAYGIKSLLNRGSSIFQDKRKNAEPAEAAPEERVESVEWKKLFLNSSEQGQEFRKLKMAIVQKEETLEMIAQRYQINPRELQLINRLQDGEIAAGQVIYIPK